MPLTRGRTFGVIARTIRRVIPLVLIAAIVVPGVALPLRIVAALMLVAFWIVVYAHYRRVGLEQTKREWEQLRGTSWEAFWRHYNERVPTVEEEIATWAPYHQHRHEMRYDLVADAVRAHLPSGGRVLDVGCGGANLADRIADAGALYIGLDFGGPHIGYAFTRWAGIDARLRTVFARADASLLPVVDSSVDVVVMSEVIEHLLRPETAVWEVARVLRPGGVFVMTTNNAAEVPLRSPLSHALAWLEKMFGAEHPGLISHRPWVWPERVDPALVPHGTGDVFVPHTHHIPAETVRMFASAGLSARRWSSFEFPPPHSASARVLSKLGGAGIRIGNVIEAVARSLPFVRRLGTHLFVVARKTGERPAEPPDGVWPGPLSGPDGLRSGDVRATARDL
jgi:2-polyprenyl-3-methyl-5-hydroxy-6-metoxy-1,4-benzoquinol methylase